MGRSSLWKQLQLFILQIIYTKAWHLQQDSPSEVLILLFPEQMLNRKFFISLFRKCVSHACAVSADWLMAYRKDEGLVLFFLRLGTQWTFFAKATIQGNTCRQSQKELAGVELMESPAAPRPSLYAFSYSVTQAEVAGINEPFLLFQDNEKDIIICF